MTRCSDDYFSSQNSKFEEIPHMEMKTPFTCVRYIMTVNIKGILHRGWFILERLRKYTSLKITWKNHKTTVRINIRLWKGFNSESSAYIFALNLLKFFHNLWGLPNATFLMKYYKIKTSTAYHSLKFPEWYSYLLLK